MVFAGFVSLFALVGYVLRAFIPTIKRITKKKNSKEAVRLAGALLCIIAQSICSPRGCQWCGSGSVRLAGGAGSAGGALVVVGVRGRGEGLEPPRAPRLGGWGASLLFLPNEK